MSYYAYRITITKTVLRIQHMPGLYYTWDIPMEIKNAELRTILRITKPKVGRLHVQFGSFIYKYDDITKEGVTTGISNQRLSEHDAFVLFETIVRCMNSVDPYHEGEIR